MGKRKGSAGQEEHALLHRDSVTEKSGYYTEPLIDAKKVPLNIKGEWRLQERAFNLDDKLPDSIMLNESHQCIARLKNIIRPL